ncbi:hypothetical protein FALBO_14705, partial [Fusarium albosuccineum]
YIFIPMELVGVAASSIALGRAIAAGRHIVNLCREPEIQHEFDELRKDVSLITAMLADVQRGAGPLGSRVTSNTTQEILIKRTTERLQEIRNELQEFVSRCGQTTGDKTIKAKRRRWIMESDKLKKLREKAMDAKMNLHFAVTCHNRDIMRAQVGELQHQFEKFTLHIANFAPHKSRLSFDALSYNSMDEEETDITRSESTGHAQVSKQLNQTEPSHELIRRISPHFKLALKQIVARQDEIGQSSVCKAIQQGGSVEYKKRDPKVIEEIGQLLTMNSDTALEAEDDFGVTPVITAITSKNLPSLRRLVNEGASLHGITDLGSILHWVGFNLDLQVLRYLESLGLTGIDVTGRNGDGHSARDYFIFTIYGSWRTLGTVHQPSLGEQHAFANLYKTSEIGP